MVFDLNDERLNARVDFCYSKMSLKSNALENEKMLLARLGGYNHHRKSPPGWMILVQGYRKVQLMAEGFEKL